MDGCRVGLESLDNSTFQGIRKVICEGLWIMKLREDAVEKAGLGICGSD